MKKLGFGLMRLPKIEEEMDINQINKMVDIFLDNGYSYFDTAYGYPNSEETIAKCLVERYERSSFKLATKLPAFAANNKEEAMEMFYTSLKRTKAEYFDYYLLHNLGGKRTIKFDEYEIWDFVKKLKADGLVKQIGFSMHDSAEVLDDILTKHPEVDFVQLQINYADWNNSIFQSGKCYDIATKHGKPIIVMEPIRGGALANPPKDIKELFNNYDNSVSYASWALRYVASLSNVMMILSGMSTIDQMLDNVNTFNNLKILNENEKEIIKNAQAILEKIETIPCTNCNYCIKDCPAKISIPDVFSAVNQNIMFNNIEQAKYVYSFALKRGNKASTCFECGLCENVCPQKIKIIEELKNSVSLFE